MDIIYVKDVVDISFKDQHETADVISTSEQLLLYQSTKEGDAIVVADNIDATSYVNIKIDDAAIAEESIAASDSISISTSTSAKDDAFMHDSIDENLIEAFVEAVSVSDIVDVYL